MLLFLIIYHLASHTFFKFPFRGLTVDHCYEIFHFPRLGLKMLCSKLFRPEKRDLSFPKLSQILKTVWTLKSLGHLTTRPVENMSEIVPDHTSNKKGGCKAKSKEGQTGIIRDLYITSSIMTTMHFTNYMNDVHTKANNVIKSKKKNIEIKTNWQYIINYNNTCATHALKICTNITQMHTYS